MRRLLSLISLVLPTIRLLYSKECPYCRGVARTIRQLDQLGVVTLVPIESDTGQRLLTDWHGEPIHAPHLQVGDRLFWGLVPVAWRVVALLGLIYGTPLIVLGVLLRAWRAKTARTTTSR